MSRRRFPNTAEGLTTREGLNLAGSSDPVWTGDGVDAEGLSRIQSQRGRERVLRDPSGLSGIPTRREPTCPVVWEPEGAIPPATRLGHPLNTVPELQFCVQKAFDVSVVSLHRQQEFGATWEITPKIE